MAAAFDMNVIEREFGRVLGAVGIMHPRYVILRLNQNTPSNTRFTEYASMLPSLKMDVDSGAITFYKKGSANRIRKTPLGSGAFGKIYKSRDGSVIYKRITLVGESDDEIEEKAREIFLEAFIQVVLSCDATYGKCVSKIKGLYRAPTSELLRKTRGQIEEAAAADPSITLYILMEPLESNMWAMQREMRQQLGRKIGLGELLPVLSQIASIMEHFKRVYGFSHSDLHGGNIMFASDEFKDPVLIDFGLSCLTLNDITYSFIRENTFTPAMHIDKPCQSLDLMILVTSLYEYEKPNLDDKCLEFLRQSTRGANDRFLINDLDSFRDLYNPKSDFHMVYPDRILDAGGELYDAIKPYMPFNHITPDAFLTFIQSVQEQLDAGGAVHYVGGRRTFRRRTFRRHRRRTYRNHRK